MKRETRSPATCLILASASPRRAEILRNAGIAFEVHPAHIDESRRPGEAPSDYVRRLALEKARAVADANRAQGREAVILGADTIVVAGGEIFGKPASVEDARRMLHRLQGTTHEVRTGIALIRSKDGAESVAEEATRVTFASMSASEIDEYVATAEPMDKAGAYAIQGLAGRYITRIEGDYFNVVGLPLAKVWELLRSIE